MGLFNDIDPIFFYHKSVKPLLAMGFNGVVTPSGNFYYFLALLALLQEGLLLVETQYVQNSLEQFVRAGSMLQRKEFLGGKLVITRVFRGLWSRFD